MKEPIKAFEDLGTRVINHRLGDGSKSKPRKKTIALSYETPNRETERDVLQRSREAFENLAQQMIQEGHTATARAFSQLAQQVPNR